MDWWACGLFIGDARFFSFGYFVLSWFVLLTELGLFYNHYYKFLMGSGLGTVVTKFCSMPGCCQWFIYFIFCLINLCLSSNPDFDEYPSDWCRVSLMNFAISFIKKKTYFVVLTQNGLEFWWMLLCLVLYFFAGLCRPLWLVFCRFGADSGYRESYHVCVVFTSANPGCVYWYSRRDYQTHLYGLL